MKQEVGRLRSLLISVVGEDPEGGYRAGIVKELLAALDEPATQEYRGRGSLLKQLGNDRT